MMPVQLGYDPFKDPGSMKRLLADLAGLVLEGKLHHRAAGCIRGLIKEWIEVDEHERLNDLEERIEELEKSKERQP